MEHRRRDLTFLPSTVSFPRLVPGWRRQSCFVLLLLLLASPAWRRWDKPRHGNALTIYVRSRNIGNEIPVPSDSSINRRSSALAADFSRRHLECSVLRVEASRGTSQRLHVIPGNYAIEGTVRIQHHVPVKCRAAGLRRRVEDVDPPWWQLLYCRCDSWWGWRRGLRSASCGGDC